MDDSFFHSHLWIRIFDFLLVGVGFLLGILFCFTKIARNLTSLYIAPELKGTKANLIKLVDYETKEEVTYINPQNFKQGLELFFTMFIWNMTGRKERELHQSANRQKRIFRLYLILIVVSIVWAIFSVWLIQEPIH